jgi:processive 1,2-diacylglycerol beta-glucosyltransferase
MKKALILTAGFGEGHNAAARSLKAAFDKLGGTGSSEIADLFAECSPRLNQISRKAYLGMINRTPRLWSAVYALDGQKRGLPKASLVSAQ